MEPTAEFSARLNAAWLRYQANVSKRLQQKDLGELVATMLGRAEYSQATVSKWLLGKAIPDLNTIAVLAAVLDTDPATLAFGSWRDPGQVRKAADAARALATVQRHQAAIRAATGAGKRRKRKRG